MSEQSNNKSLVGDLGNNPAVQAALAGLLAQLLSAVPNLIGGLFNRKPKEPVKVPTPAPTQPDPEFPDDTIPAPTGNSKIEKVRLKLARAQYNRQRFPNEYTPENPFGLYSNDTLRDIEAGNQALNYGSKFWLDLTAYDAAGREIMRDRVLSLGLAFKTEFNVGEASIKGNGSEDAVEVVDTEDIGNGITAFNSSLGFLHQLKAHGEGEFECSGSVDGVKAEQVFTIRVS
jgi:hypothetical protein